MQPLNTVEIFDDMMYDMQDFYSLACPAGLEVTNDFLEEGGLYAVRNEDTQWYRYTQTTHSRFL